MHPQKSVSDLFLDLPKRHRRPIHLISQHMDICVFSIHQNIIRSYSLLKRSFSSPRRSLCIFLLAWNSSSVRFYILLKFIFGIISGFHCRINPSCTRCHFFAQDVEIFLWDSEAWEDMKKRSKNLNGRIMRPLPGNTLQYVNLILIYCEPYSSVKSLSIFLKGVTPDYDKLFQATFSTKYKLFQTTFFKSLDFPYFIGNTRYRTQHVQIK